MTDDPLMVALIQRIPPLGSAWPLDQRALWISACEAAFNLIYGPVEKIDIPALFMGTGVSEDAIERLKRRSAPGSFVVMDRDFDSEVVPPASANADLTPGDVETLFGGDPPAPTKPAEPASKEIKAGDAAPVTKGRAAAELAPRPAGIPTTFAMIQVILGEKPGLTARELVEAMAARWWPELEFKRVAPDISTWVTKGRIERDADGKLTLTEQGRNVPSFDLRKTPAPEPAAPPAADPPPSAPPAVTARGVRPAATRFAEGRARAQARGSTSTQIITDDLPAAPPPKPTAPQPLKVIAPPPGATHAFEYGNKTVMLSLREHRMLSRLKMAMGKGMLDGMNLVSVAFAGEAAKVSNSEVYLREVIEQLGPRLDILGLEMVGVPVMPGGNRISGYVLRGK